MRGFLAVQLAVGVLVRPVDHHAGLPSDVVGRLLVDPAPMVLVIVAPDPPFLGLVVGQADGYQTGVHHGLVRPGPNGYDLDILVEMLDDPKVL